MDDAGGFAEEVVFDVEFFCACECAGIDDEVVGPGDVDDPDRFVEGIF